MFSITVKYIYISIKGLDFLRKSIMKIPRHLGCLNNVVNIMASLEVEVNYTFQ